MTWFMLNTLNIILLQKLAFDIFLLSVKLYFTCLLRNIFWVVFLVCFSILRLLDFVNFTCITE